MRWTDKTLVEFYEPSDVKEGLRQQKKLLIHLYVTSNTEEGRVKRVRLHVALQIELSDVCNSSYFVSSRII
jgi:predicted HAD superfamily phosphohydrolase YqeG